MIPGFSLRQLGYLSAIADHGTIAAAAEAEHVSQAAISMGIQDLERRLGLQLLARRPGHGVTLTEAGLVILDDARRVIAASEDLMSSAQTPSAELRGVLRIGFFATLSAIYLPPLLSKFATDHPAVKLTVLEGSQEDLRHALQSGRCELVITYSAGLYPGVALRQIRRMPPYILLSAGHGLANRASVSMRELAELPMIEYVHEPSGIETFVDRFGFVPHIVHSSANIEVVRSLVARGLGWTIMFQRWPSDFSLEGLPLRSVPLSGGQPTLDVVAAWPEQDQLSRRAMAVVAALHAVAETAAQGTGS